MQRTSMLACVLTVVLVTGVDGKASGRGFSALMQSKATQLSRWQERVGVSSRIKSLLSQAGMAAAFCTTLACNSVTRAPEITASTAPTVEAPTVEAPAMPETQKAEPAIIRTELFGIGFTASRGLTYDSVQAYVENKEQLPVQFYDGMMIHQVKDGKDYVRIVDLIDDAVLRVRHIEPAARVTIDVETITGVMIGQHPDYGTRHVSVAAELVRALNDDGGEQLLTATPEGTTFYGEADMIFSDGDYVIKAYAFALVGDKIHAFPAAVRFIVKAEHLVTIERPAPPPQDLQRRSPTEDRQHKQQLTHYRADDDEALVTRSLATDNGVFSSR